MSFDLYLYCKKIIRKKKIDKVLKDLGFKFIKEGLYSWFVKKNLTSFKGCRLSYNKADHDYYVPRGTKIIFTSTTSAARSHEDFEMQIKVIKTLKKEFGGSAYDPQEGRYAYPINTIPKLSYREKLCGMSFLNFIDNIHTAHSLSSKIPKKGKMRKSEYLYRYSSNTSILINNLVIVYLVAIFEAFLKDFFIKYVETSQKAKEKIYQRTNKLEFKEIKDLLEGSISLTQFLTSKYTFQNLNSANAAYYDYVDVKLLDIWNRRKKYKNKFFIVREVLEELIQKRHEIVHEYKLDYMMNKQKLDFFIIMMDKAADLFDNYFLNKRKIRLNLEIFV